MNILRTLLTLLLLACAARAADMVRNATNASPSQMQSSLGLLAQGFDKGAEATRLARRPPRSAQASVPPPVETKTKVPCHTAGVEKSLAPPGVDFN